MSKPLKALARYGQVKFDFKRLSEQLPYHIQNAQLRKANADPEKVIELWQGYKQTLFDADAVRKRKNKHTQLKPTSQKDRESHKVEGRAIKEEVVAIEESLKQGEAALMNEALRLPNRTSPESPIGDEARAIEIQRWGEVRSTVPWKLRDHVELGQLHDLFDFEAGSRVTGSKYVYLKNEAAVLELKLISWALDELRTRGYTPVTTPDLARNEVIFGCGFNPRDPASQIYNVEGTGTSLIGTSEITLGGLYAGRQLSASELPVRLAGFSH